LRESDHLPLPAWMQVLAIEGFADNEYRRPSALSAVPTAHGFLGHKIALDV